jgi:hypothetical protein
MLERDKKASLQLASKLTCLLWLVGLKGGDFDAYDGTGRFLDSLGRYL